MGWSIGFDSKWQRDIGYAVPAVCDHPDCDKTIDRGLPHVCGGEPYGGDYGCGLYFCGEHLWVTAKRPQRCKRCSRGGETKPFAKKPDVLEWMQHKLNDPSWAEWREEHAITVRQMEVKVFAMVAMSTYTRQQRIDHVNALVYAISRHGRRFFHNPSTERVACFADVNGNLLYADERRHTWIDPMPSRKCSTGFEGFSHGGTLLGLVGMMRDYITDGEPIPFWYITQPRDDLDDGSDRNTWGYAPEAAAALRAEVAAMPIIYQPASTAKNIRKTHGIWRDAPPENGVSITQSETP